MAAVIPVPVREAGPFRRARWPWRLGAVVTALGAGALLAWILALWGWRLFGPASAPPVIEDLPETWTPAIVAAAPFGRAPPTATLPATAGPSSLPPETKLLGVFASRGGEGYALLRLPDRGAILIKKGQRIVGEVKLAAVNPDGIRIEDRGETRTIALRPTESLLPAPVRSPLPPPPRPVASAAPARRAACTAPAGFSGPTFRLNAELLSGMVAKPESWTSLLAPVGGALVVRDESGLAAMLGMKAGDRVAQANGIALVAIDDMLTAVVRPLVASQPVRIAGTRDGKPREWLFLNAGACPP